MKRRTKIVATIGPASQGEARIIKLITVGMNVARLNFSHGTHEYHAMNIETIRTASQKTDSPVTILQDLQGPKIRTGDIENGQVELYAGQGLDLTIQPVIGNTRIIPVDFPQLLESAVPGGRILLDDGNLELIVDSVKDEIVHTQVVLGGTLKPNKGVNLPGAKINIPGFTKKDAEDLAFGLKHGVDVVAVSFVRSPKDIQQVRNAITHSAPHRPYVPIIAKLERPEALAHLEEIVQASDGVMVARGDLGVEMSPEAVPVAQKKIIAAANRHARIVITATQMLDSMMNNPRPTRAEAADVANAIFDGTDAVMLSGETAAGKYPIQAVEMMQAIICQAEANLAQYSHWQGDVPADTIYDDTYFVSRAARELAHDRNVAAIVAFTQSGRTACMISKMRPEVPILAFTPNQKTYQRLNLLWGVQPYLVPHVETLEEMLMILENNLGDSPQFSIGQQIVLICGYPIHATLPTNMTLLYTIGSKTK